MNPADFLATSPRRTRISRIHGLVWLVALAIVSVAGGARAGAPLIAFNLNDLNPGSSRLGRTISPRDYGQWISAYYFGNEG